MSSNPYEPARVVQESIELNPANRRRWAAFGFLITCLPIAACGAYGLYNDAKYAASLPPDTPRCGNGALAAMLVIFPISPMIGCFGAAIGLTSAIIRDVVTTSGGPPEAEDVG